MTDLRERLAEWWSYDVGRTMELCQAEIARLTRDNAVWQRNNRDTFDAMCAMRNAINEILPMPSLESDLLQGPESSVFCASVAAAVVEHVSRLTAALADANTSVIAFGSIWAVQYAKDHGFPDGHLAPNHYDILAKAGARMDGFSRAKDMEAGNG